jgi:hypothetical protein
VHLTSLSLHCDATRTGAEGALEAVSNVMDKNLAAPPPLSDVDPGVLSVANSTVRIGVM